MKEQTCVTVTSVVVRCPGRVKLFRSLNEGNLPACYHPLLPLRQPSGVPPFPPKVAWQKPIIIRNFKHSFGLRKGKVRARDVSSYCCIGGGPHASPYPRASRSRSCYRSMYCTCLSSATASVSPVLGVPVQTGAEGWSADHH
jgi:hypothetical protein